MFKMISREFGTLTHINSGNFPEMVSILAKAPTFREAVAEARVRIPVTASSSKDFPWRGNGNGAAETRAALFSTAVTAGVLGAKKTSELIPMCHQISLRHCAIEIHEEEAQSKTEHILLRVTCKAVVDNATTGVEMEALTGCSIAALTLYDMLKSSGKGITLENLRLLSKTGGKSGTWVAPGL
jgi:cyclic pyranopterin phosphate synthase